MIFNGFPDAHSPYFIRNGRSGRQDWGGYSPCIKGKIEIFPGSVLNNCVGCSWGCAALYLNDPDCKVGFVKGNVAPGNAKEWWNDGKTSKWDHFERGTEPREGAIICYGGGDYGHVAFVNEIRGDKLICISSGYGNTNPNGFDWREVKRSENYRWPTVDYLEFQGFIYLNDKPEPKPDFPDVSDVTTDMAIQKMALDVIQGMYGNGFLRAEKLYDAIQGRVNAIMWSNRKYGKE